MGKFTKGLGIALAPVTGGTSLYLTSDKGDKKVEKLQSGIKGLLTGKEIGPDPEAGFLKETQLRASQAMRSGLENLMAQKPSDVAEAQIAKQSEGLQTNLADIRRRIQQNIARKGLANTSIGQAAMTGAERDIGKQISLLQTSKPLIERQLSEDLIRQGSIVSGAQKVPINFQTQRTGGIAGLLGQLTGAGIGAYAGGPEGAKLGAKLGQGVGQAYQGMA